MPEMLNFNGVRIFYSVLGVKLLSTVDHQGSWHMHFVYVSCRW